ncbi:juvenile hormone esterase-like [Periplaneta americana]|uniref:juvenile hormone esterase-like n=1 Tax=Periplaneta americana TaxID=6978 RepID=UPI0037E923DB
MLVKTCSSLKIATTLLLFLGTRTMADDITVTTNQGQMQGITMTSRSGRTFYAFLGIPFAAPPVGELRFMPPAPPERWDGVFNATKDGPLCLQKDYLQLVPQVQGQEDCLYLNVYTPTVNPAKPLSVMVYVHGGGFFSGTGASFLWGPRFLLDKDVVLVTFNYRVGALGFLSTGDNAAPGNYGLKDQVAALQWVRANIAALGGDPLCVTLFGQSAGGAAVHYHMLSPLSGGLFHRAISQSGTALDAWAWPADSLALARRQAMFVGCDPDVDTATMVKCLRQVDVTTLVDSGDKFKFWSVDPLDVFGPVVEQGSNAFLTGDPFYLLKTGQFHRVPWMTGVVTDEGIVRGLPILKNATLLEDLNQHLHVLGPRLFEINKSTMGGDEVLAYVWERILSFFLGDTHAATITPENEHRFIDAFTDRSFVHGFHRSALLHRDAGHKNVFLYHFDYRGLYSFSSVFANTSTDYGVSHCDDLIYLFHLPLLFGEWPPEHPDLKMSEKMIQLWTDFAKFGTPSADWEPQSPGQPLRYMQIRAGPSLTMQQDLFQKRMDFWDSLPLIENSSSDFQPSYYLDLVYNYILYLTN